jgi:acyl-CoA reductase-like NAD-dependent aldehyde dehydrogenase
MDTAVSYELKKINGRPIITTMASERKPSSQIEIDQALEDLNTHKDAWTTLEIQERIAILDEIMADLPKVSERWIRSGMQAQSLRPKTFGESEHRSVFSAIYRNVRLLRQSLQDIEQVGRPRIPGSARTRSDGQVVAPVFPQFWQDRLMMPGVKAEVWMDPQITEVEEALSQASFYRVQNKQGKVALVLGAGNTSALVPADFLYKLFVEGQVVILKPNPVNEYLGPLIEEGFQALIKRNYLRLVYGGAHEGAYLVEHSLVDEIHMTGSDKTYDAIQFGTGEEGARRKSQRNPRITKRFTAELGNISPVIVVPGPWRDADIDAQAGKLGTWLAINAGNNCLTPRMIINWRQWEKRQGLIQAIEDYLAQHETRKAYYPGAIELHAEIIAKHPQAKLIGDTPSGYLPWTLIPDVEANNKDEICFNCEAFCSLFAETALEAETVSEYIDKAVEFANNRLWGNLVASIIVHPKSMKDRRVTAAVKRAIEKLRYGTVVINSWGVQSWMLMTTTWGAFPGNDIDDIQSGLGVVNNVLMFDHPQKSVTYSPFIQSPDPMSLNAKNPEIFGDRLIDYQQKPSIPKLACLMMTAMKT